MNNVQRCLRHFYTWMRHSKQTATLLLTKRHANFDTSTSAKGYARVYELCMRNCSPWHTACSGSPHNAVHSSSYQQMLAKSTAIKSGRVIARQLRRHVSEEAGADAKQ